MKSEVYEKTIIVNNSHLDDVGHVNNVVYLEFVQDIAREHWQIKSNPEFDTKYFWVVLEHNLKYKRQAFLNDELLVRTFVERNEGAKSFRHVEFLIQDKLTVSAVSTWCLINRANNRPTRVPDEVDDMFFKNA